MKKGKVLLKGLSIGLAFLMILSSLSGCTDDKKNKQTSSNNSVSVDGDKPASTVKISDFGGIPNDDKDDAEALRQAIKAADELGKGSVVMLESGTYNINTIDANSPSDTYHAVYMTDIYDITIQGNDTEFLIGDPYTDMFNFLESGNITIKGITFDYAILPFVQGEVIDFNSSMGYFTIKLSDFQREGKNILDDVRWLDWRTERSSDWPFGMIRDTEDPRLCNYKESTTIIFHGFESPEKLSDGVYRIVISNLDHRKYLGQKINVGTKIVLNNRCGKGIFNFKKIKGDVTIEDCTIYASTATSYQIGRIEGNVVVNNCKTMIKPNSGRWLSTNADGVYGGSVKGSVTVTNCLIEGVSDDTVNLYNNGLVIHRILSENRVRVTGWHIPKAGEKVLVIDPLNGKINAELTVKKMQNFEEYDDWQEAVLCFEEEISEEWLTTTDYILPQDARCPNTVVSGNTFRYNRGVGVKLNTRDSKITNNVIENVGYHGITLHDIPGLNEISGTTNMVIDGNTIRNAGYTLGRNSDRSAGISVSARTANDVNVEAQGYMHDNVTISNNVIENVYKNGIYVSCAQNVTLTNNTINGKPEECKKEQLGGTFMGGLVLRNVKNVKVSGLKINNLNPNFEAGIRILEDCFNVKWESCDFKLANGIPKSVGKSINN